MRRTPKPSPQQPEATKPPGLTHEVASTAAAKPTRVVPLLIAVSTTCTIALVLGFRHLLPFSGIADTSPVDSAKLADLALSSSQYLQSLTTAVFALATLALGQEWLGRFRLVSDGARRQSLACGIVLLVFALIAGFVNIESIIQIADDQL